MHHGTCVTHVPWWMSGSLTPGGRENVPGIPGACATRNFTYLARDPWPVKCGMKLIISSQTSTAATWESISNLIPHFMIGTITYPCLAPDWLWTGFTSKLKQWHHITVITSQNTDNDCFFNYFLYVMAKQRNIEVLHYCPFVRRSISIVAEQVLLCSGSIYLHGTILIPASIINHIPSKVCDESTYPLSNFNCRNVEVREWISNFIPHFTRHMIIYPFWDLSYPICKNGWLEAMTCDTKTHTIYCTFGTAWFITSPINWQFVRAIAKDMKCFNSVWRGLVCVTGQCSKYNVGGNWSVISSHILWWVWLLIHSGITVNPC